MWCVCVCGGGCVAGAVKMDRVSAVDDNAGDALKYMMITMQDKEPIGVTNGGKWDGELPVAIHTDEDIAEKLKTLLKHKGWAAYVDWFRANVFDKKGQHQQQCMAGLTNPTLLRVLRSCLADRVGKEIFRARMCMDGASKDEADCIKLVFQTQYVTMDAGFSQVATSPFCVPEARTRGLMEVGAMGLDISWVSG